MLKKSILSVLIFSLALSSLIGCDSNYIEYEIIEVALGDVDRSVESNHSFKINSEPEVVDDTVTEPELVEEVETEPEVLEEVETEPEVLEEVVAEPEVLEEAETEPEVVEEAETEPEVVEEAETEPEVVEEAETEIELVEEAVIEGDALEEVLANSFEQVSYTNSVSTLVPVTTAVSNEYFQDALFIGDSILKGFKAFASPYPDNVIAEQNVGLDQIMYNKDIYYTSPSVQTNLWSAVGQVMPNPEKIYVLIGVNGVPGLETEQSMYYYQDLIVKLKAEFPDKLMYFCALTPLTQELSERRAPSFCTSKIEDFNKGLFDLCQSYNVYFLQTDEVLKDSAGYLMSDYDAGDGMHLNKNGHTALLEYFKNHTVSLESII